MGTGLETYRVEVALATGPETICESKMSDSLLTKYRPSTLEEVMGQNAAVTALADAIEKKRGRAFLFMGPSGTGKTTLARIAAKMLGCTPNTLVEVDAASQTGIDDMRAVSGDLLYQPLDGEVKAVIVDEAHALSRQAWTSLLKSIEEPPEWAYWFFCTTEQGKIPDNIRTRCLRYELKPVSRADLRLLLDYVVEEEGLDFKGPQGGSVLELCAQEAHGSPRQALANLATVITAANRKEAAELLRSATESNEAVELARALVRGAGWTEIQQLLNGLSNTSPESVRHVVNGYVTKAVLGAAQESAAGKGIEILDVFSQPFYGMHALIVACGKLVFAPPDDPPF